MKQSSAKVWVIFGKAQREWFLSLGRDNTRQFTFNYDGTAIRGMFEYDDSKRIERIYIFCHHPKVLYYSHSKALEMEPALNLAAALVNTMVRLDYLKSSFPSTPIPGQQLLAASGQLSLVSTRGVEPPLEGQELASQSADQAKSYSFTTLSQKRALVESIAATHDEQSGVPGQSFNSLPNILQAWLRLQQIDNLEKALEWSSNVGSGAMSLVEALFATISSDLNADVVRGLLSLGSLAKRDRSKYAALYRKPDISKGDPTDMLVSCKDCGTKRLDLYPTYLLDGRYIVRMLKCFGCERRPEGTQRQKMLFPVDETVPVIRYKVMMQMLDD